jgi:hypothetical protein
MLPDTRNKNIYVYGICVGISTVYKILETLLLKGDETSPYGHDQHTIKCSLTKGIRIYVVYGWGSQWFSRYYSTSVPSHFKQEMPKYLGNRSNPHP